jgi:Sodium/hydrogen exchanger family
MISVDTESFLTVVMVGAIAAFAAGLIGPRLAVPVVVIEIVLGIVVGPEVLGLADPDEFLEFFSSLGLGMLFFFAGYEIDFERIRGDPLKLAAIGWAISLALAYDDLPAGGAAATRRSVMRSVPPAPRRDAKAANRAGRAMAGADLAPGGCIDRPAPRPDTGGGWLCIHWVQERPPHGPRVPRSGLRIRDARPRPAAYEPYPQIATATSCQLPVGAVA